MVGGPIEGFMKDRHARSVEHNVAIEVAAKADNLPGCRIELKMDDHDKNVKTHVGFKKPEAVKALREGVQRAITEATDIEHALRPPRDIRGG